VTYTDSLWKDAPKGASHLQINENGLGFLRQDGVILYPIIWPNTIFGAWAYDVWYNETQLTGTIHPRPQCYTPAAQLVDQYRKEHGEEIEVDAGSALKAWGDTMELDSLMFDAAFHLSLLEKYLAAERARVEGEK